MSYDTDLHAASDAQERLRKLRVAIETCQHGLAELHRYVSDAENTRVLSYDDFVRAERHIHPVSDEKRGELEEAYRHYRERTEREHDEHLGRAQTTQAKVRETLTDIKHTVAAERELQAQLLRTVERLHETITTIHNQLDRPAQQLTVEHVQQTRHALEAHDWGKPRV